MTGGGRVPGFCKMADGEVERIGDLIYCRCAKVIGRRVVFGGSFWQTLWYEVSDFFHYPAREITI